MPHSTYMRDRIGSAVIVPDEPVVAGSYTSFDLIYTAGFFGIDDSGSIKIVQRFATDMAKIQFDDPTAPNYVSIEASNKAVLSYHWDVKNNIRPWGKTLYIKIVKGYFREGDQIIVRYGDKRQGSPGVRMQTFCEDTLEYKVLVDAFATYDYVELPQSPTINLVPGYPARWKAVLPTTRRPKETFRLSIKAEDRWGNPSDRTDATVFLRPSLPVAGLPGQITFTPGMMTSVTENLTVDTEGDLVIDVTDASGTILTSSNPCRFDSSAALLPFWADMHGQSEETIGSNSARDYFSFARDKAFLDATCHQGNDFQITKEFWQEINDLTREFDDPGRFVAFPGYEWSGNTGLGGDHNIIYLREGEQIHRSCHALVYDLSDADTDRHTTRELFETLKGRDVFVYAHVGGRYADLSVAKEADIQPAVEIHSAWGTFEWLLHDALSMGMTVGVVTNSDGHKGRPGASYPGASMFGCYGGLTCFLARELTREAIFDCLKQRHHYGTTGVRMVLDTRISPDVMMGDCVTLNSDTVDLSIAALCPEAIERIEIFNGTERVETIRPYRADDLGRRIRVIWEGAEYRGRGRETIWDGAAAIEGNSFEDTEAINFWNQENQLVQGDPASLSWKSLTTGGLSGFEALLKDPAAGTVKIDTPLLQCSLKVSDIGIDDTVFDAGGLGRKIKVCRVPDDNTTREMAITKQVKLKAGSVNPLYVKVTLTDGHMALSSPIYITAE